MNDDFVKQTCKLGQGASCCKYLMMWAGGWGCVKMDPLKAVIDRRTDMHAKGDNCPGFGIDSSPPDP